MKAAEPDRFQQTESELIDALQLTDACNHMVLHYRKVAAGLSMCFRVYVLSRCASSILSLSPLNCCCCCCCCCVGLELESRLAPASSWAACDSRCVLVLRYVLALLAPPPSTVGAA